MSWGLLSQREAAVLVVLDAEGRGACMIAAYTPAACRPGCWLAAANTTDF
jgi:hypothetical protein